MKIDVTKVLKDLDGKDVIFEGDKDPLELRDVLLRGLSKPEPQLDPAEHVARWDLMLRVTGALGEMDVTAEEITKLKGVISNIGFSPVVIGQSIKMMEGEAK